MLRILLAAVLSLVLLAPATARGQSLFVKGAAAFPAGDEFGNEFSTGRFVAGGVKLPLVAGTWFGIEASLSEHEAVNSVLDLTLNLVGVMALIGTDFPTAGNIVPYVYGGLGVISFDANVSGGGTFILDSESEFAWQVGVGSKFGGGMARPFIEGRFEKAGHVSFLVAALGLSLELH